MTTPGVLPAPLLRATDLVRRFDAASPPALDGVSLELDRGELLAAAGPSGSGKTTLLAILAGLDRPSAGRVLLGGEDLYARAPDALARLRAASVAFVFQSHNLIPTLTAEENVALAVRCVRGAAAGPRAAARSALEALGLGAKLRRLPGALSLGEQQRVAVARAIAVRPALLVADEPTASLDGPHGEQVLDALDELRRGGCAVLLASHDERCLRRAGRVLRLLDGRPAAPPP
jgi:putative ABC transport system ATP-binding protein